MNQRALFDFDSPDTETEIAERREFISAVNLRPYQEDAVDAVFDEWRQGSVATLLCLPTGCGKSVCFSEVMRRWVESQQ